MKLSRTHWNQGPVCRGLRLGHSSLQKQGSCAGALIFRYCLCFLVQYPDFLQFCHIFQNLRKFSHIHLYYPEFSLFSELGFRTGATTPSTKFYAQKRSDLNMFTSLVIIFQQSLSKTSQFNTLLTSYPHIFLEVRFWGVKQSSLEH